MAQLCEMNTPVQHSARPGHNNRQRVHQSEQHAGEREQDGASDAGAEANARQQRSGKRCGDEADQIHDEEQAEFGGGEREGRRREIERDVSEDADERKQHVEANEIRGEQARIPQVIRAWAGRSGGMADGCLQGARTGGPEAAMPTNAAPPREIRPSKHERRRASRRGLP